MSPPFRMVDPCDAQQAIEAARTGGATPENEKGRVRGSDIALVGMACMFPRAKDVRRYWQNICNRVDAIQEVPPERWRIDDFYSEDRLARDRVYSKWGGFLEEAFFDPVKWHVPPASLRHIEPMQLLSLEVAWQAMVDAGYDRRDFPRERAGVLFAVPGSHEWGTAYCFRTMMRHYLPRVEGLSKEARDKICASLESQLPEWTEDSFPGFLGNVVAGRIAREFDLHGPNFTVDAACAASLAALFTAVEQLRSGTSDLMLVGAADGTNNPFGYMSFAKTHALSPRGKSRAFDESADGIALGEGIACVVLKRLRDAERDGDRIYAIVKGIGSSSDGKNRSLTAPFPPGQSRAVNRAYEDAEISPASVSLIEAHGTGTAVGDCAELATLTEVFAKHTTEAQYVAVGSVKSMIGHTKTVAGLASVIKTALALKHRVLPPTIGIDKPNSRVDLERSPFYLNTETRPWLEEKGENPRRAGVSSFGFGGTNFHVVLEEYTGDHHPSRDLDWTPRAAEVIVFQRASRDELIHDLQRLQEQLASVATDDLGGLAAAVFASETGCTHPSPNSRLALVATSVEDLRQKVQRAITLLPGRAAVNDPSGIYYSEEAPASAAQVCFLYPGQGSQGVNMLRDLVVACPWCHGLFVEANRLLRPELPNALSKYVYPPPVFDDADRERQAVALTETRVAQPALGLIELFATDLLERFGVRPALVAGHSYGELVALHVAGCLSRIDLLRLSANRGRVCADAAQSCPGAMASVQADAATTEAVLREWDIALTLANVNAPDQTVIAGSVDAIDAAIERLPKRGLRTRKLPVSAAFHTAHMAPTIEAMRTYLAEIGFEQPRLPVYSNTTGLRHADQPDVIRQALARHCNEPVLFEKEVRQLFADGARVFIEVGPGKVLTDLVGRILKGESVTALSVDAPGREGWTQLGHVLARLAVLGLPVRLGAWFEGRGLDSSSVADFIAQAKAKITPKLTDWVLSPNKAEPVTPLPNRQANGAATAAKNGRHVQTNGEAQSDRADGFGESTAGADKPVLATAASRNPHRGRPTLAPRSQPEKALAAMTTFNEDHCGNKDARTTISSANDLFTQFQATTRLLLEAQQTQNRVLERYLETQERLLLHCAQGVTGQSTSALSPSPMPAAPLTESVRAAQAPHIRPTEGGARPPIVIPANAAIAVPQLSTIAGRPSPIGQPHKLAGGPLADSRQPTADSRSEGPPATEQFRQDLLEVVSARTGYPIDALDETLALEAALGIDSIKTVEIFSNLKTYHPYFRAEDQEEEELLAEFTKLKTLRDIVNAYDRRRQAHLTATHANGNGKPAVDKLNGADKTNGSVKRFAVAPVDAPREINGLKKNDSLTGMSSL